ncbi:MAG: hypothetical protein JJU36_06205 [Phycisphaeraceae bacterium]|nr:hypothetical protein [Phycisphaeraceae bacterium]
MFGEIIFPLFGAFFVLVIVLVVLGIRQERKRREELSNWARQHGLHFSRDKRRDLERRFRDLHPLGQGSNRYAYNVISGQWRGREILAFDYHYQTTSTDSKGRPKTNHHHFSAVIVRTRFPVKPLLIRGRNFFDSISSFFGFADISFESAEFNRAFTVKAPDRRWAYDVLHTRAMRFLLDNPRFSIEFDHHHGIAWRNSRFKPQEFERAVGIIEGLLDQLPDYLRSQQMDMEAQPAR